MHMQERTCRKATINVNIHIVSGNHHASPHLKGGLVLCKGLAVKYQILSHAECPAFLHFTSVLLCINVDLTAESQHCELQALSLALLHLPKLRLLMPSIRATLHTHQALVLWGLRLSHTLHTLCSTAAWNCC